MKKFYFGKLWSKITTILRPKMELLHQRSVEPFGSNINVRKIEVEKTCLEDC